ncbi:FAD-binding oxidoreductase [Brevibacillus fluminis]|uniref:FAD-binding oxidoreductase n=1 Tax=Brevibacillus fluminis TaxID=511487 RepID=A0A3M8DG50_9BACL|nr:FAD-binding oxidoreductase [Brevibacillus fluminis]RNB87014.1 FAD-binding oxidoreductase [Brevibacillus fluminis]
MHGLSLWSATANAHRERASLQGNKEADVVIVGAGYTGLSTAYHASQLGLKVIVVEQNEAGWGASGRNAGMILPGYKDYIKTLAAKHGLETAKDMFSLSLDAIALVKKMVSDNQIACDLAQTGHLIAATKPKHMDSLREEQEFLQKQFHYRTEMVTTEEMRRELDSPLFAHGGLVDEHSCSFHPLNYALGLADATEALGGVIYERSRVIAIDRTPGKVIVRTAEGAVTAKELVIATNGYTDDLVKKLTRSVYPIASYMVATEPLAPDLAAQLVPRNRMVFDTKNFIYYFRLTPDGRLVFGGKDQFTGEETAQTYEEVRDDLIKVFPQLKETRIDYKWGGLLGVTYDMLPYIGQLEDGTHFSIGCAGHGAAITTMLGKIIAQNIAGESRIKKGLETVPLKQIPFHGQRAFVLSVLEVYYKLLDIIA